MKKILVPIDGSIFSNTAIEKAKELAEAFHSEVVLLNVIEKKPTDYPSYPHKFSDDVVRKASLEQAKLKDQSWEILEHGKQLFSDLGDHVKLVSREGEPTEIIIDYAEKNGFDLVIIGSKGRTGIQAILMGSVARQVSLKLNIPIMIIK